MTTDIYEQHNKAFSRVSAYVIMKGEERVATVAIKYPADGVRRAQPRQRALRLRLTLRLAA